MLFASFDMVVSREGARAMSDKQLFQNTDEQTATYVPPDLPPGNNTERVTDIEEGDRSAVGIEGGGVIPAGAGITTGAGLITGAEVPTVGAADDASAEGRRT